MAPLAPPWLHEPACALAFFCHHVKVADRFQDFVSSNEDAALAWAGEELSPCSTGVVPEPE